MAANDGVCLGLQKVVDSGSGGRGGGAVYWVCEAHANAHKDRFWSSQSGHGSSGSNSNSSGSGSALLAALPKEDASASAARLFAAAQEDAAQRFEAREAAARDVAALEVVLSKSWAAGDLADAWKLSVARAAALENNAALAEAAAVSAAEVASRAHAAGLRSKLPAEDYTSSATCLGGCGEKVWYAAFVTGKQRHRCKVCCLVVCKACSPPPRESVAGYLKPQRVCAKCVGERARTVRDADAAKDDAAARSAAARELAQRAAAEEAAVDSGGGGAAAFLESALKAAKADDDLERAAALKHKLARVKKLDAERASRLSLLSEAEKAKDYPRCAELKEVLKSPPAATLGVAIALEAFPVGTKVRASVASGGAAAGTAGEVSGHTPDAKVEVRFKEGTAALAVASLRVAELPAGWAAGEKCFSALDGTVGGTELAVGQEGQVVGWSEPFDCDRIAVEFNGRRVNVLNSEIQTVSRCSGRKKGRFYIVVFLTHAHTSFVLGMLPTAFSLCLVR